MTKWIIQSNPNMFDAVSAFNELHQIDWKQSIKAELGDITYIYVAAPVKAIRLKCKVVKLDIPKAEIDDHKFTYDGSSFENYGKYMRLELMEEYDNPGLSYQELAQHGLKSVQGPMKIIGELEEYIDQVLDSSNSKQFEVLDASKHIEFKSIFEAINACIGTHYTGWMKACYPSVNGDLKFRMWFPKLAKIKNGEKVSAAFDCINTISDDWNQLVFEDLKKSPDYVEKPENIYKGYDLIFAKDTDGGYLFRGVYVYDEVNSKGNRSVSKRIATKVRLLGNPTTDIELIDNANNKDINVPKTPKRKTETPDGIRYVCAKCGYKLKKAPRCPNCGQLIDYDNE